MYWQNNLEEKGLQNLKTYSVIVSQQHLLALKLGALHLNKTRLRSAVYSFVSYRFLQITHPLNLWQVVTPHVSYHVPITRLWAVTRDVYETAFQHLWFCNHWIVLRRPRGQFPAPSVATKTSTFPNPNKVVCVPQTNQVKARYLMSQIKQKIDLKEMSMVCRRVHWRHLFWRWGFGVFVLAIPGAPYYLVYPLSLLMSEAL